MVSLTTSSLASARRFGTILRTCRRFPFAAVMATMLPCDAPKKVARRRLAGLFAVGLCVVKASDMGEPDNFIDDIRAQSAPNALLDALLCPVCESKSARHDFDKDSIPYYRCQHCMFRFSRPKDNANFRTDISGFEDAYVEYLGPWDPLESTCRHASLSIL